MSRNRTLLVVVLLVFVSGPSASAQTLTELAILRLVFEGSSRQAEDLDSARHETARRLLSVADATLSLQRSGRQRAELLGQLQGLSDHMALLDDRLGAAIEAADEARHRLIQALESEAAANREAAQAADPGRRSALEVQVRDLERELGELRSIEDGSGPADPLLPAAATLSALAGIVAQEQARVRGLNALQDEMRLFLGNLRLFDETGMPPSVRAQGGGDPGSDPVCPASCAAPMVSFAPADRPLEHFQPEGGRSDDAVGQTPVTTASLARLEAQLAARTGARLPAPDPDRPVPVVTWETTAGAGLMTFRGQGEEVSGLGPKAGMSLFFSRAVGSGMQLTVEPWLGGRTLRAAASSSAEVAGDIRETLTGVFGGRQLRWRVMSWQKGRFLSDPLPLPGYLEPGRTEGGLAGRLAVPIHPRWDVEVGGGGDVVRYGPDDWRVVDRQGLSTSIGVAWRGDTSHARLSLLGSRHGFPHHESQFDPRREDTRVGLETEWTVEGRIVARLSAGVARNTSRLTAYDFRSGRAALVLSAPLGRSSIQAYGALAHRSYLNPGPEGGRVAPSDQETGSILALQLTRPLGVGRALALRAEWSRSETGFRDDFYRRFGISVQVTFRGPGRVR